MGTQMFSAEILAYIAGGLFTLGYLIINQVILRLLITAGTIVYITYYWTVSDTPLWEAIYMSILMGTANLIGLAQLLIGRSPIAVPRAHRDIYPHFANVPPGDFRNLVLTATREKLPAGTEITREGQAVEDLYFVISGKMAVEKKGEGFVLPSGVFVGEVAYMTGRAASATTIATSEIEVLRWSVAKITRKSQRSARFKLAMEALISRDMALKVAFSVAPRNPDWDPVKATHGISNANPTGAKTA